MADNIAVTAGTGTNVATDEVGGAHYQRVKVTWGADGTANDANATTPLPVAIVDGGAAIDENNPLHTILTTGAAHIGSVGGYTPRVTATYVRASDATTYAIGDMIGNSTTAASVVPIEFAAARISGGSGRVTGCRCVLTAASGTVVIPKFDLLLFRPVTNIPFTAGSFPADNAALNVSSAAYKELVGVLSFSDVGWRNQAGGSIAVGGHLYQAVSLSTRQYAPFNFATLGSANLIGVLQAQSAWAPGAVAQTFDFALDVDAD